MQGKLVIRILTGSIKQSTRSCEQYGQAYAQAGVNMRVYAVH